MKSDFSDAVVGLDFSAGMGLVGWVVAAVYDRRFVTVFFIASHRPQKQKIRSRHP